MSQVFLLYLTEHSSTDLSRKRGGALPGFRGRGKFRHICLLRLKRHHPLSFPSLEVGFIRMHWWELLSLAHIRPN